MLQVSSLILLQHSILPLSQHCVAQGRGQVVGFGLILFRIAYLYILLPGIHAQGHVGGQCPGGSGPGQNEGVLPLHLELGNSRAFLHVLITLGHLVRGKGCAAAGAVGHNFKALVKQALVPNLL